MELPSSRPLALVRLVVAASLAASAFAAGPVRGAESATVTRPVGTFTRIRSDGAFTIRVTAGASAQRVTVSGDPSVVARTTTTVEGDTLVLAMAPGNYDSSPTIEIGVAELRRLDDRGASQVTVSGVSGDAFELIDRGASRATISGNVRRATLDVSGAGNVDASGLRARDVVATDAGVGRIELVATGSLTATVSGVGRIRYCGNPAHVDPHVTGVGSIEPC